MTIPPRLHFCWIGPRLPWAYAFAVLSAAARGEMAEIVLHHTGPLEEDAPIMALRLGHGVRLERTDAIARLIQAGTALGIGAALADLYRAQDSVVKRADILRAAILYLEGGIYLDLDTVTVASLRPLLAARQFVGSEWIVWPAGARNSRSPLRWARHLTLDLLRKLLRRMPGGWRGFRHVEHFYFRGINNAVMGSQAGAPMLADYLRAMPALPPASRNEPYALGPDLLQAVVDRAPAGSVVIHPPEVFYPLPPEISEHWFRDHSPVRLAEVLSPATRVAHWYASVRTRDKVAGIDPDWVRDNHARQLYSALVAASLADIPPAGDSPALAPAPAPL